MLDKLWMIVRYLVAIPPLLAALLCCVLGYGLFTLAKFIVGDKEDGNV